MKKIAQFLANLELILVAIPLAASLISARFLPVTVILMAFFWPVRCVAYGRFSQRTSVDIPILILLATLPITLLVTAFPEITSTQVLRLLSGIGLFYAIINWNSNGRRFRWLVNMLILSGLLLAAVSPFVVDWSAKLGFIPAQIYQSFSVLLQDSVHPNVLAGCLALLLPISFGWLLFAWREITFLEKVLSVISSIAMFLALLLTQSRGAWVAVFAVLIFFPVFRWRWGWVVSALGVFAAVAAVNAIGFTNVLISLVSGGSIKGIQGRLEIWERAYFMIRDFPFTGIGMGSFTEVVDAIYPFTLGEPGSIFHAHNLFLQIGGDLGVIGLSAWLVIFVIQLIQAWKSWLLGRKNDQLRMSAIGFAVVGSLITMAIHGMTDAVIWGMVRPAPLVWAVWGIGGSGYLQLQSIEKNL